MNNSGSKNNMKMISELITHTERRIQFTRIHDLDKKQQKDWKRLKIIMGGFNNQEWDVFFQYGFEVLGPLLFGFCKWLHEKILEQKFDKLFFLSRDGYLPLNAYKELYHSDKIPVSYLYISRKTARTAQLWLNTDLSYVSKLFPANVYLEREGFFRLLNIKDSEANRVWKNCGLTENIRFLPKDLMLDKRLMNFYEEMKPEIIKESRKAYTTMMQYLHQNNFNGKVGIVDIGWNGTIQNCLEAMIQNNPEFECEIVGCYLGLLQEASKAKNKLSYIAPYEEPQEFDAAFVEYPFLAPEGSLTSYSIMPNGTVKPILSNFEYEREGYEIVKNMQAGAIYFLKCMKGSHNDSFNWESSFSYANMKRISKHPTLQEVNLFGDLAYYDGEKRQIAAPRKIFHYLVHMKDFSYDLSVSGWRIGFLKRFLKINLNYNRLLKLYKNTHKT